MQESLTVHIPISQITPEELQQEVDNGEVQPG